MEHLNLINMLTYVRQRLDELLSFTVMSVSLNCDELLAMNSSQLDKFNGAEVAACTIHRMAIHTAGSV